VKSSSTRNGIEPELTGCATPATKIDYLLLSPKLWQAVAAGGVMRQGMWPGVKPAPRWTVYPELDDPKHAASDHAALWVDLKL
jgi:hypothetical protein